MSVSVNLSCPVCGNNDLKAGRSTKVGLFVAQTVAYCPSCFSIMNITGAIEKTKTATWTERPEIHRINKPLKQVDPNQLDFITELENQEN